ncbi:MAG: septum formation initiator family protein [bacterium]
MQKKNNLNSKNLWYRIIRSRFLLPLLLVALIFVGISLGKEILRKYRIDNEIKNLEADIQELEHRNQELSNLLDYLQTDSYKEIQAREQLGLQKEGETAITIQSDLETPPEIASFEVEVREEIPNPLRWWNYFFDNS